MKEGYTIRSLVGMNTPHGFECVEDPLLIAIECTNGDTVYMTPAPSHPPKEFELVEHAQALSRRRYRDDTSKFSGILFPVVDINQKVDISWLCNLNSNRWFIEEALQQTKFHMDELGAHVQSAVAIHVTYRACIKEKPVLEMNGPFYLWIERPGMELPLFAAYIDYSDLKEIGQKS